MSQQSSWVRWCLAGAALAVAGCAGPAATLSTTTPGHAWTSPAAPTAAPTNPEDDIPLPLPGEDVNDYYVRCYAHIGLVAYNMKREFPDRPWGPASVFIPSSAVPFTDEQRSHHQRCNEVAIAYGIAFDENDPEQVRERYQDYLDLVDCLAAHGYPVPNVPSAEVFIEAKGADFDPFSQISVLDRIKPGELCPSDSYGVGDMRGLDLDSLGGSGE